MTINSAESDEDRFKRLYDKYYVMAYKLVRSKVSNFQIIEDVLQDIWLKIWSTMHKIENEKSERPWISTLTCHMAVNESKKDCMHRKRYPIPEDDYYMESIPDENSDPTDIVVSNDTAEYIYEEIKKLDEKYAYVLTMNMYFQCTPQEIAILGNVSVKTVYTQLSRGKAILREKLLKIKEAESWTSKRTEMTK